MKKKIKGKKLSRSRTARDALFRSQLKALLEYGEIKTTKTKAKAVQPWIDNLIARSKKDTLSSRRQVLAILANDRKTTDKLYKYAMSTKYNSGFSRIVLLSSRRGDNAPMVKLLWSQDLKVVEDKKKSKKAGEQKKEKTVKDTKKK